MFALDFVKLDVAGNGVEYALVMTDVFTKFTQAVEARSQEAKVVTQKITDHWFKRFGVDMSPREYTQIKADALNQRLLTTYVSCTVSKSQGLQHAIHKGMVSVKNSIRP